MCEICHGHPGCPVCNDTPEIIECPTCMGEGKIFYSLDEENQQATKVTHREWEQLPLDKRDTEMCPTCMGYGYID